MENLYPKLRYDEIIFTGSSLLKDGNAIEPGCRPLCGQDACRRPVFIGRSTAAGEQQGDRRYPLSDWSGGSGILRTQTATLDEVRNFTLSYPYFTPSQTLSDLSDWSGGSGILCTQTATLDKVRNFIPSYPFFIPSYPFFAPFQTLL